MITELQQRIIAAHNRGDRRELEKLQDEFRRTAVTTSADRGHFGGTVTLVQPGARVNATPTTRASAVQAQRSTPKPTSSSA
jgi:hypothetical protein